MTEGMYVRARARTSYSTVNVLCCLQVHNSYCLEAKVTFTKEGVLEAHKIRARIYLLNYFAILKMPFCTCFERATEMAGVGRNF